MPSNPYSRQILIDTTAQKVAEANARRVSIFFSSGDSLTAYCYLSYQGNMPDEFGLAWLGSFVEFKRCDHGPLVTGEWYARLKLGTVNITVTEVFEDIPG